MDLIELTLQFTPDTEDDKKLLNFLNQDTDIVIYSGDITSQLDKILINILEEKGHGTRIVLFLTTYGGDPDAAYRTARFLQCKYNNFSLVVVGECKSAGSLLALGANEIIMGLQGEFGPLDVQLFRPDEFVQRTSGLTISQALSFLSDRAFNTFEEIFLAIRRRSGGIITTTTASEIASSIVTGIYAPITEKIDAMRIGEMQRSIDIAIHYGVRLGAKQEIVEHLVKDYPSHSFVIDYEEAKDLFQNVRLPNQIEEIIITHTINILEKEYGPNVLRYPTADGFIGIVTITKDSNESNKGVQNNAGKGNIEKRGSKKNTRRSSGTQDTQGESEKKSTQSSELSD